MGARTAVAPLALSWSFGGYARHRPEEPVLYQTLQAHWLTFLAGPSGGAEVRLPRFVLEEVEAFLKYGTLAQGFCGSRHDDNRDGDFHGAPSDTAVMWQGKERARQSAEPAQCEGQLADTDFTDQTYASDSIFLS